MKRKILEGLFVMLLMLASFCMTSQAQMQADAVSLGDGYAVKGRYAIDRTNGNVYYLEDDGSFFSGGMAEDGRIYDDGGAQVSTLSYVSGKYKEIYDNLGWDVPMKFESFKELQVFANWLQLERSEHQGNSFSYSRGEDGTCLVEKEDLAKLEEGKDPAYLETVRHIAAQIPAGYTFEEKIDAATNMAAHTLAYDKNYMKESMNKAVNDGKGVCYHYAKLLKDMLAELGIESEFMLGYLETSEPHTWLRIWNNQEGRWLYRDPTKTRADINNGLFTVNLYEAYVNLYRNMELAGS